MHLLVDISAGIGGIVIVCAVVFGCAAWFIDTLPPGSMP
jgi:hypothetical protein